MAAKGKYFKHPRMGGGQGYIPGKREVIKDTGPSPGKLHKALIKQKLLDDILFPVHFRIHSIKKHKHLHFVVINTLPSMAGNCCL